MQFVGQFLIAILLVLLSPVSAAHADGVKGEGRLITATEAKDVVKRYKSIPGDGVVKGEGRLITTTEAKDVVKRYKSIPGDGVKGEGRLITTTEAKDVVKRYKSIPGDGVVKGEGRLITTTEAKDVVKRYKSIPGDGVVKGEGRLITRAEAQDVVKRYRSIPGGFLLEGNALGMEWAKTARYDRAINAFVLDNDVVYLSPIPALSAAVLARAIAADDRVGVSLGEEAEIVYGKVPKGSPLALDLKMADNFLGDMILPPQDWTIGYRFANGFEPRYSGSGMAAVFFRFRQYEFATKDKTLELTGASFDARVVPILTKQASDGGYLPDYKAITAGGAYEDHQTNAGHVGENIKYYLQEKIVERALAYGEVAAFFRTLKAANVNLRELARNVEASSSKPATPAAQTLEDGWLAYLSEIQTQNQYANWSAPPHDLYLVRKKSSSDTTPHPAAHREAAAKVGANDRVIAEAAPRPAAHREAAAKVGANDRALADTSPRPTAGREAASTGLAKDGAIADCLRLWDRGTHMTKQEWSRTCRRVQDRISDPR